MNTDIKKRNRKIWILFVVRFTYSLQHAQSLLLKGAVRGEPGCAGGQNGINEKHGSHYSYYSFSGGRG